jgi:hypothetical protein
MNQPAKRHTVPVFASAALLVLLWVLSVADPCLIAFASGGDYIRANPIAIVECSVTPDGFLVVSVGDVIMRLAALAILMGLFGYGFALLLPALEKRRLAWIAAAATTCSIVVTVIAQVIVAPWATQWIFDAGFCVGAATVTLFGVRAGVRVARPTVTP